MPDNSQLIDIFIHIRQLTAQPLGVGWWSVALDDSGLLFA
jgi:hypothetical protein